MIPDTILIYITLAIALLTSAWAVRTELKFRSFMRGKDAKSLEETIRQAIQHMHAIDESHSNLNQEQQKIKNAYKTCIRAVETIRFNPFDDAGGNQSFATAYINALGDGVILSTLYSRDRTRVFAKPLTQFQSQYELSQEEKEALDKAQKKL